MKKICFGFILGILVTGGIVYAASLIDSNKVSYTPSNSNWQVANVQDAIDNLYENITNYNQVVSNYNEIIKKYHRVESGSFPITYSSSPWTYKEVVFAEAFNNQPTCFYRYSGGSTGGSVFIYAFDRTRLQIGYKTFYQSNCPGGSNCSDTIYWACYE